MRLPNDAKYWLHIRVRAAALKSDGCTGVPEFYHECCLEHDIHYKTGKTVYGDPITRAEADARLYACIASRSTWGHYSPLAWWRWAAVRAIGWHFWEGTKANG